MLGRTRGSVFAFVCFAMVAGGGVTSAGAGEALDVGRLPRVAGAKTVFASPWSAIYIARDPVQQTAEATAQAFVAEGWQSYAPAFAQVARTPSLRIMSFKKGTQAISVTIMLAPAQGNATSVNYSALALPHDLPFPKDATEIEFDPDKPHLSCFTGGTIEATLGFFRKALGAQGWSPWSVKTGAKQPASESAGGRTENGAYAYFVRDDKRPLALALQRGDDGRIKVELKGVPATLLVAEGNRGSAADAAPARASDATPAPQVPAHRKIDQLKAGLEDLAEALGKQMQQAMREAFPETQAGPKPPAAAPARTGSEEPIGLLAGNTPVPLPDTAKGIDFDGADGRLAFRSASSVTALAAFYRATMRPLGWQERPSVINRANMVVLDFSKAESASRSRSCSLARR